MSCKLTTSTDYSLDSAISLGAKVLITRSSSVAWIKLDKIYWLDAPKKFPGSVVPDKKLGTYLFLPRAADPHFLRSNGCAFINKLLLQIQLIEFAFRVCSSL